MLSKVEWSAETKKEKMMTNLNGEMTVIKKEIK